VALDAVGHDEEVAAHAVAMAVRQAFRSGHDKIDRVVCVCLCNLAGVLNRKTREITELE
jgi:hypothetical protein